MREAFRAWKLVRARYLEQTTGLSGAYRDGVYDLDLTVLLQEWHEASSAMVLVRSGRKKRVWERLALFTDAATPDDVGAEIAQLMDLKTLRKEAGGYDSVLAALRPAWDGLVTNVDRIEGLFAWAQATQQQSDQLARTERPAVVWIAALSRLVLGHALELSATGAVRAKVVRLLDAWRAFTTARGELARIAGTKNEWLSLPAGDDWIIAAAVAAQRWADAASQTQRWCKYREVFEVANASGLAQLAAVLESGTITPDQIVEAFELGYARWWVEQVVDREEGPGRGFVADYHNDVIARFAEMDTELAKLARRVVLARLSGNLPPRTAFGRDPEFGTLAREIEKKSRHIPLRQLFGKCPRHLPSLPPA